MVVGDVLLCNGGGDGDGKVVITFGGLTEVTTVSSVFVLSDGGKTVGVAVLVGTTSTVDVEVGSTGGVLTGGIIFCGGDVSIGSGGTDGVTTSSGVGVDIVV